MASLKEDLDLDLDLAVALSLQQQQEQEHQQHEHERMKTWQQERQVAPKNLIEHGRCIEAKDQSSFYSAEDFVGAPATKSHSNVDHGGGNRTDFDWAKESDVRENDSINIAIALSLHGNQSGGILQQDPAMCDSNNSSNYDSCNGVKPAKPFKPFVSHRNEDFQRLPAATAQPSLSLLPSLFNQNSTTNSGTVIRTSGFNHMIGASGRNTHNSSNDCCNNIYKYYNHNATNTTTGVGNGAGATATANEDGDNDDHMIALLLQEHEREEYEQQMDKAKRDKIDREREIEMDRKMAEALQNQEEQDRDYEREQENNNNNSSGDLGPVSKTPEYSNAALHTNIHTCYECKQMIRGSCLSVFGVRYHSQCFKCDGCQEPISGGTGFVPKLVPCAAINRSTANTNAGGMWNLFDVWSGGQTHSGSSSSSSSGGGHVNSNRVPGSHAVAYHPGCAKELYAPRCCLCSETLQGKFFKHAFFKESDDGGGGYCPGHQETQDTCCSCGRLEPLYNVSNTGNFTAGTRREPFVRFPDGRLSCYDCISTAVLESTDAKSIYLNAVSFMEKELMLVLPPGIRDVPILAVDIHALNEQTTSQSQYSHGRGGDRRRSAAAITSITRGLTLSSSRTIKHFNSIQFPFMSGVMTDGSGGSGGSSNSSSSGRSYLRPMKLSALTTTLLQPRTEEVRSVTAILVLYGLPWDLTAAILAHEAMHAYCKLTTDMSFQLPSYIEEGLCQYVSFQYLDYIRTQKRQQQQRESGGGNGGDGRNLSSVDVPAVGGSNNNWAMRLIDYYKYQISTDSSEIYGRGYREINNCCSKIGLQFTLEEIRNDPTRLPTV